MTANLLSLVPARVELPPAGRIHTVSDEGKVFIAWSGGQNLFFRIPLEQVPNYRRLNGIVSSSLARDDADTPIYDQLTRARVFLEIGETDAAQSDVIAVLDEYPRDHDALELLTKILHMRGEVPQALVCRSRIDASVRQATYDPELEEVAALLHAHRTTDARALCVRIAADQKEQRKGLFKRAVLLNARICELAGDLYSAQHILEELGREAGYEVDLDRGLALARIYEQLERSEDLEKAIHILGFIHRRIGGVSILKRLSILHRRLGDRALFTEYARRHDSAFRRSMLRPSLSEVIAVASETFVPLEQLLRIRFAGEQLTWDLSKRGRALALVLEGDLPGAKEMLESSVAFLDQKYLENISTLEAQPMIFIEDIRHRSNVGCVLAVVADHFSAASHGLVQEIRVRRERTPHVGGTLPDERILGKISFEVKQQIQRDFVAVRDYACAKFPHLARLIMSYNYVYELQLEDGVSLGADAALASALAFMSVFFQRDVPRDLCAGGALTVEAFDVLGVEPVEEPDEQVKAACSRNLNTLLLSRGSRLELEHSTQVPPSVLAELVVYVRDLDEAVRHVFGSEVFQVA
jgi:hypothetical protein